MNPLLIIFLCILSFAAGVGYMGFLMTRQFSDLKIKDAVKIKVTPDYRTPEDEVLPSLIEGIRERRQVFDLKQKISKLEKELEPYLSLKRERDIIPEVNKTFQALKDQYYPYDKDAWKEAWRLHGYNKKNYDI